jgi:hypothetical protein
VEPSDLNGGGAMLLPSFDYLIRVIRIAEMKITAIQKKQATLIARFLFEGSFIGIRRSFGSRPFH